MEIDKARLIISKLPLSYRDELKNVVNNAMAIFKDNLINMTLGGSGGKGNAINGWSDLDVYIVLNIYNTEQVSEFMKTVNKNSIHTGTTFYTLAEVENDIVDMKTKVMLYEKQAYDVNPTLYGIDIFKEVTYEEIKKNDRTNFPNVLHDVRRRYIELCYTRKVEKAYIKKLLVLVKCMLNSYDIFTYGYDPTFRELFQVMYKQNIDLTPIKDFDIVSVINNLEDSTEVVINFSEFLLNYIGNVYNKGGLRWEKELVLER